MSIIFWNAIYRIYKHTAGSSCTHFASFIATITLQMAHCWFHVFFSYSLFLIGSANLTTPLPIYTTANNDTENNLTTILNFTTNTTPVGTTTSWIQACGNPRSVFGGSWTKTSNGTMATYVCTGTRMMSGTPIARCFSNSTWSAPPRCVQVECLEPPKPLHSQYYRRPYYRYYRYDYDYGYDSLSDQLHDMNRWGYRHFSGRHWNRYGRFYQHNWQVGRITTYTCDSGYEKVGNATTTTCQSNLTWTPLDLECKKRDCGSAPELENGIIISVTETTVGGVANYKCLQGYHMATSSANISHQYFTYGVSCSTSGNWVGLPTCLPFECGESPTVQHASKNIIGKNVYQDTVIYECAATYELIGNNTISCGEDAKWSTEPSCKKLSCSKFPEGIPNGVLVSISSHNFGGQAVYECMKGYHMIKSPSIVCMRNGTWTSLPICKPIDCGAPPSVHFGSRTFESSTFTSNATYTCEDGFKIIGINYIRCRENGQWEESPLCERTDMEFQWFQNVKQDSSRSPGSESSVIVKILTVVFTVLCLILFILSLAVLKVYQLCNPRCVSGSKISIQRESSVTQDRMGRPFAFDEEL